MSREKATKNLERELGMPLEKIIRWILPAGALKKIGSAEIKVNFDRSFENKDEGTKNLRYTFKANGAFYERDDACEGAVYLSFHQGKKIDKLVSLEYVCWIRKNNTHHYYTTGDSLHELKKPKRR